MRYKRALTTVNGWFNRSAKREAVLNEDYSCSYPSHYVIESSDLCNLKCPVCVHSLPKMDSFPAKGVMKLDDYRTILGKIGRHAKKIYYYNWGEPFLNREVLKMVRLASERGIETDISSNLSLREIDAEAIIRSGLDHLVVSIDGATQEVYEKYRIGGELELVLANIRAIQIAKNKLGSAKPTVYWQFLVSRINEHEIEAAKRLAAGLGTPIYFNEMIVLEDSWKPGAHDDLKLHDYLGGSDPEAYERSERALPRKVKDIVLHPWVMNLCRQTFELMIIGFNGDVYPCCSVYNKEARVGNLLEQSLNEVWNGKWYRDCRRYLYHFGEKQEKSPICGKLPCFPCERHPIASNLTDRKGYRGKDAR
ncbi:MAG TPA: radical SAM/SPASM domain-containing protein [Candidatus Omnitrophota bacterium]|nr:radical SAM/SPASM domain-containing protein [Candidatus Omnitrophota bacterium]